MLRSILCIAISSVLFSMEAQAAFPGQQFNLSPTSHQVVPVKIYQSTGVVANPSYVLSGKPTLFSGQGSSITLDFGQEVGGLVTLHFGGASTANESLGLAFSESTDYIGTSSDGSNSASGGGAGPTDGAIYASVGIDASSYTMPNNKLRGGFRYLTLFMNSGGVISLDGISLNFTPAPNMPDPSAYPNYFYSNDTLLNQLWYAGAYTVQTDTIAPDTGRVYPGNTGWDNSAVIAAGTSVLSDGAKRDRAVWPGDVGISAATAYVSTADTVSVQNVLQRMYDSQQSSGELPFAGPPINFYGSDTYHLWTLIGTANYYVYSGNLAWLQSIWAKYKLGIKFSLAKVNGAHGLMNVTGSNDWARGDQGGENIAANAMLYHALMTGSSLATAVGDTATAQSYLSAAATLKANINAALWDNTVGAYRDNPSSTLYPQDGNSLAVWFDVVSTPLNAGRVADYLKSNWNTYGSRTPEWNNNISPFAGSMELMAQAKALHDTDVLALIRREWGYMFNSPRGTKTFWEGYAADGSPSAYASWYTSYSHGWSTGPTSLLSFYTLGITPTASKGTQYSVIPHPGDLTHVEGQLQVDSGKLIKVSYDNPATGGFSMTVDTSSNTGSSGVIAVPRGGLNPAVSINGSTAWDGQSFVGSSGIASADADAYYVYFRGVQPGQRTLATAAAATWSSCSNENGLCSFAGNMAVRYGSGSSFVYGNFANGAACSNSTFGDPTPNVVKHCELSKSASLPPAYGIWHFCSAENQQCSFTGTHMVAFGANGLYLMARIASATPCTDAVFGDPVYGLVKQCYYADLPDNPGFETPAISNYAYAPAGSSWAYSQAGTNQGAGIEHTGGDFGAATAPDGVQAAFVQNSGSLQQSIPALAQGTYAVRFAAARRGGASFGPQSFDVLLNGSKAGSFYGQFHRLYHLEHGAVNDGAGRQHHPVCGHHQ